MGRPGFFNDNSHRAYPLVPNRELVLTGSDPTSFEWPHSAIVDFLGIIGESTDYDDAVDRMYLYSVTRDGDEITFRIRSTAETLYGFELVIVRDLADQEYVSDYVLLTPYDTELAWPACAQAIWECAITTGDLTPFAELPADTVLLGSEEFEFEPTLVQNLGRSRVASINIANLDRTQVLPPLGCPGADEPQVKRIRPRATCISGGVIYLQEGFNCRIRQDAGNNALTITASVGAGAGEPCEEVETYAGEAPPDDGELLSGGPRCQDLITSLNGVGGRTVHLVGRTGVRVTDVDPNTVHIDADLHDLQTCETND